MHGVAGGDEALHIPTIGAGGASRCPCGLWGWLLGPALRVLPQLPAPFCPGQWCKGRVLLPEELWMLREGAV